MEPTRRPLLLMDIDGVLCPIGPGPGEPMRSLTVGDYPVTFSQALGSRLSTLGEVFTLVWATSWQHDANRWLAPVLGLPQLPVIAFGLPSAPPGRTWKLTAVQDFVGDRAMAWIDDELGNDAHTWARRRSAPTLLLDIHPGWGLAAAQVDELITFAKAVSGDRVDGG